MIRHASDRLEQPAHAAERVCPPSGSIGCPERRAHELERLERRKRYMKEQRSDTAGPSHSLGANSPKCFAWMFGLHLTERIAVDPSTTWNGRVLMDGHDLSRLEHSSSRPVVNRGGRRSPLYIRAAGRARPELHRVRPRSMRTPGRAVAARARSQIAGVCARTMKERGKS